MQRVGELLGNAEDREAQLWIAALREELAKLGWTESRNVQIDIRSPPADVASMKRFAKELARSNQT
jgi:putative ABC transport system substrate-binding protein